MKLLIPALVLIALVCIVDASVKSTGTSTNKITTDTRKLREENEKKEISAFFSSKNLIKTVIKMLFGNNEESAATSRQFLTFLVKFIDVMRGTFLVTPQARSATGARELANQVVLEFERRLIKYLQLEPANCDNPTCLSTDGPITFNNLHQY